MRLRAHPISLVVAIPLVTMAGCDTKPSEPTPTAASSDVKAQNTQRPATTQSARARPTPPKQTKRKVSAKPTGTVKVSDDDPIKGKWSLEDATKGLPAGKTIVASIETDKGTIECKLFDDLAPITVANFVGLARGTRPWKTPEGTWEKKPAYDGTVFHRIIKGFMIQGGDAKKNGSGEAGYVIPDEIWEDANHDRPGLLCMANRGPNTNSAQFFITDAEAFHLDNNYTIFGECGPTELVHTIANVEMDRGDKPKEPPAIKKVTITRKEGGWSPPGVAAAPASSGSAAASASAGPAGSATAGAAAPASASTAPKKAATAEPKKPTGHEGHDH